MGYPILVFHREEATDTPEFIGRYCLNNDKSNAEAFGLKNTGDDGADSKTIRRGWMHWKVHKRGRTFRAHCRSLLKSQKK